MLSRSEYESWFGKVTDKQWREIASQIAEIEEKIWNEDHPLDD